MANKNSGEAPDAPAKPTYEQLAAHVAELEAKAVEQTAFEKKVAEKIGKGLKREQAEAAVRAQQAFDASDYGQQVARRYAERQAHAKEIADARKP
jgi:hypothetical protein